MKKREISPLKCGWPSEIVFQDIVTLDPNKFAEMKQKSPQIGNLQSFTSRISLHKKSTPVMGIKLYYDPIYRNQSNPSYPSDMKGFLYYHMSPEKRRIAGELRVQVTSSEDPASFESGSDLLRTNGRTWMHPLYGLKSKHYFHLYAKLREEQIVSDELDAVISTLPSIHLRYRWSRLLYTLNDTFIIDFRLTKSLLSFFVITEQGVERSSLSNPFRDHHDKYRTTPYTGSALARFERSTLPDHKGTRTVVMRFLKIITPVKCVISDYDDYVCYPKEGELHRRCPKYGVERNHDVWSVNIDVESNYQRGLQLLWDA